MSTRAWLVAVAAASGLAACGSQSLQDDGGTAAQAPSQTRSVPPGRVEVIGSLNGDFNPAEIYRREAPGVVTVISEFGPGSTPLGLDQEGGRGLGSGFVLNGSGEIATNAHVVSNGQGARLRPARAVYVQFADGNQVSARIVGTDPNSDVGLLRSTRPA